MDELGQFLYDLNHKRGRPTNLQHENSLAIASILQVGDSVFYDIIEGSYRKRTGGIVTKLEGVYVWINNQKYRIDRHNVMPTSPF